MKNTAILLLSLSFLAACDDDPVRRYPELNLEKIHLRPFSSCEEIDKARTYKRQSIGGGFTAAEGEPLSSPASADSGGSAPKGETNLQVSGVDEMDTAKADGDFIYTLATSSKLAVLRRSPVGDASRLQEVAVEGASGLFVTSDRVIALGSTGYGYYYGEGIMLTRLQSAGASPSSIPPYETPKVLVQIFSRKADGTLEKVGVRKVDGSLADARMIGNRLHLVVQSNLGFVYADEQNVQKAEALLPKTSFPDNENRVALTNCVNVLHEPAAEDPSEFPEPIVNSIVGVVSFDIKDPSAEPIGQFVASNGASVVYASPENMFIASWGWQSDTPIHQFALATDESPSRYVGSALVPGSLHNQFSMDEFEGHLRVATTSQGQSNGNEIAVASMAMRAQEAPSGPVNHLAVFRLVDGDLQPVGGIDGLAQGESIYATRFMGSRGFIVTFQQIDPLFAIDLSDPNHPTVKGELKVPGFSTYLHPMKEGFLLAIGQDAEGFVQEGSIEAAIPGGMAMSVFDVRDLASPKLVQKIGIGSRGTNSEALHNHHAFRFIPETEQVVIPVSLFEGSDWGNLTFEGFQIYKASIDAGFELQGSSAFPSTQNCDYGYCWSSWGASGRSFFKDGVISMVGGGELVLRNAAAPNADQARINIE